MKDKLITEALEQIGYMSDDYLHIAEKFHPGTFEFYMNLAFAIGFDEGMKENLLKNNTNNAKAVKAYTKSGTFYGLYPSAKYAAKQFGIDSSTITRAIRNKNRTAAGLVWKYA